MNQEELFFYFILYYYSQIGTPMWRLILKQFDDQLVKILLAAAFISLVLALFEEGSNRLQAFVEPLVIALILIANATVGVLQETNAEKALEALKEYEPEEAIVLRSGRWERFKSVSLVPGDLVMVSAGDKIGADVRVIEILSTSIRVDQSILTGESVGVQKDTFVLESKKASLQLQTNMLFSGTTISSGKAEGVVVATGSRTAIGKIHEDLMNIEEEKTPLKKKLDEFGNWLSKVITWICILVWIINIGNFKDPSHGGLIKGAVYYFKIAVALAVAAIPEGLPTVVTTCLALGTIKMARKNAIVRSLPSVETLGCTNVICSDKTGTLTTNRMSVAKAIILENINDKLHEIEFLEYELEDTRFNPSIGKLYENRLKENLSSSGIIKGIQKENEVVYPAQYQPNLDYMSMIFSLCNESIIGFDESLQTFEKISGESTEVALLVFSEKLGFCDPSNPDSIRLLNSMSMTERAMAVHSYWKQHYTTLSTLEFTRDRKSMSVLVKPTPQSSRKNKNQTGVKSMLGLGGSSQMLLVKGAPESILERCTHIKSNQSEENIFLTPQIKKKILDKLAEYSSGSMMLRCLGCAMIENCSNLDKNLLSSPSNFHLLEKNMTFIGMACMLDPPRSEVKSAIETCQEAGIRVVVITGDNKGTAESICRRIGLFDDLIYPESNVDLTRYSFTGSEFDELNGEMQKIVINEARLFSRVEPRHKSQIVDLLQKSGMVVAMTGDGVNDAPALKKADIGIAMGSGTAVAKMASDMILQDDNFSTIVSAIEEGRAIYNNTKQFIRYLISSNIGEVVCIFLTAALGMPEALIPVQLLWVNLVTDGLPATALGFNRADKIIMKEKPRKNSEPIVTSWLFIRYMIIGIYVGIATVAGYVWWYMFYDEGPHISWYELTHFHDCASFKSGCDIYNDRNGSTMSLSILVTIEMFNAMNSLSENLSLLQMPLWTNPWLVIAISISFILHFFILYIPFLTTIFSVVPLNYIEWKAVLLLSFPVIIIDEILKYLSRNIIVVQKKSDRKKIV